MQNITACMARAWATNLRYRWSRLRHMGSPKHTSIRRDLYPRNQADILFTTAALHQAFVYVNDGLFRLYDSIDSPAGAWERAFNPGPLRDDCDGYHAALLWAVNVHMKSYLLTIVSSDIVNSHTCLYLPGPAANTGAVVNYRQIHREAPLLDLIVKVKRAQQMPGVILAELSDWTPAGWVSYKTLEGKAGQLLC